MIVKLAEKRGFCFGVEDAIEIAEAAVREHGPGQVIALGPVIHNPDVVRKLESAGLNQSGDLEQIEDGATILIRSHGAPPQFFERAEEKSLNIVDATCVLVTKAQQAVKHLHEEGYQVVMIGDADHPEVRGVLGYAPDIIVLDSIEEIETKLQRREKLGLVAQTTHSPEHVGEIIGAIAKRPFTEIKIINTLCLEVVRRQEAAVNLCSEVEVMFVLGGLHSANTRELARLCSDQNMETYHLESWSQFNPQMVTGKKIAGVTAGASTPEWIIQEFVEQLRLLEPAAHCATP
ncbi:MAG: 4-hydroxy-3-methylbut-2-enyl diphosphate reductase [Phycisphaerae bacterium]|nr:4-hydroxy-3-methylbut-2-enyl diphosphate reductase [Phycisphaerae bacterium]